MSNISVIGAGYVGLVTAACFADMGHKVTLLEIDTQKLDNLRQGILPVYEADLPEMWQRNTTEGRILLTDNYAEGLKDADFAFVAVGTPSSNNGKPDLRWVRAAAKSFAENAQRSMIVVIKSTVPVGTSEMVARIIARDNRSNQKFPIVSNPEFLREGVAVFDFMHPTRVVVGAADKEAGEAVAKLYESLNSPLIMCDNRTAEFSKYASNVFLAARISFMNEIALLCDKLAVDVTQVSKVVGKEPRCGEGYLSAGLGWGGSCLPKDIKGLMYMAKSNGVPLHIINAVQQINQQQLNVAVNKIRKAIGTLEGKTVGILGLSFKPDSNDLREASSLSLIPLLEEEGCQVKAYDPIAMKPASRILLTVQYCNDPYEVARGSDALVLVTEWDEFKTLDMRRMRSLMKQPVLIDGRNMYDPLEMARVGFYYEGIGRCTPRIEKEEVLETAVPEQEEPVLSSAVSSSGR